MTMSLWGHAVHWTILEVTGEVELVALSLTSTGILTLSFGEKGVPVENSTGAMSTFGETQRSSGSLVYNSHNYYSTTIWPSSAQGVVLVQNALIWGGTQVLRPTYLKHIRALHRWGPPSMEIHSPSSLSM